MTRSPLLKKQLRCTGTVLVGPTYIDGSGTLGLGHSSYLK